MACGLGEKIFGDDEKMTKVEFLMLLNVGLSLLNLSILMSELVVFGAHLDNTDDEEDNDDE